MTNYLSKFTLLVGLAFLSLLGACTTNEIIEELPNFRELMTTSGPYTGWKRNEGNLLLSRNTQVVIRNGTSANQVLFEESSTFQGSTITYRFRANLDLTNAGRNAVKFTIPQQNLEGGDPGQTIVGQALVENATPPDNSHGIFEAFDLDRNPLRPARLTFRIAIGTAGANFVRWTYNLPPCSNGQTWNATTQRCQ
jgi:hypothetical protein